jgi:hypothetical protein
MGCHQVTPSSNSTTLESNKSLARLTCRAIRPGRSGISSCPARSARATGPCGGRGSITRSTSGWQASGSSHAKPLRRSFTRPLTKGGPRPGSAEGLGSPPDRLAVPPGRSPIAGMVEQPTLLHHALHTPAVSQASCAASSARLSRASAVSRSSGKASAHCGAALPRRRVAGGGGLALPRWLREGEGGLGRGKAPSCSSSWSARTPTLEFIPIKPSAATGSDEPGNYAAHSRFPSPDRGYPPSTDVFCL